MRKLIILTSFRFKTGEWEYQEYRNVLVNALDTDVEDDVLGKAEKELIKWFPSRYPESELLHVIAYPTIGSTESKPTRTGYIFSYKDKPEFRLPEDETLSVEVIIDMTGEKKYFVSGWFDFETDQWFVHENRHGVEINRKFMKWAYNPLTHPQMT